MRNKRLDVLRCVAVLLVIIHHAGISSFFTQFGWTGVDLFFVLSGFLISGLLFSEYKRRRSIHFKRFFIRRGLKIYPAFYLFLFLTWLVSFFYLHSTSPVQYYLHDIFFVMNYEHGVWDHTWTLAIEEHFYIFLPIFLILLVRFSRNREDPFRATPWASVVIATTCLALRAYSIFVGTPNFKMAYISSHERMDSLFFGVLLGYLFHFRPGVLQGLSQPLRNRLTIAVASGALLSSAYLLPRENRFFATFGYSFVYLGFGGVLLLSLFVHGILPKGLAIVAERIGSAFSYVGMYSYSIYLWHGPTGAWLPGLVRRTFHMQENHYIRFGIYVGGSLFIGIMMSKLVEYPILRLRDRLFPTSAIVAVQDEVPVPPHGLASADLTSSEK